MNRNPAQLAELLDLAIAERDEARALLERARDTAIHLADRVMELELDLAECGRLADENGRQMVELMIEHAELARLVEARKTAT